MTQYAPFPLVRTVGFDGILVTFAEEMAEPANRAALAFRSALDAKGLDGVLETSATLASAYVRFNPLVTLHADIVGQVREVLNQKDWYQAALPTGRKLWRVPTIYGTDLAPQMEDAATAAGLSVEEAIERLSAARVRVLTIGFAPGQPYLGPLGPEFNIPRLNELTPMVPAGALVLAISQFVLFSGPTPTGWRHVGQTAFRCYRPEKTDSFALTPGDEMQFASVSREEYEHVRQTNPDGATWQEIVE